MTARALTPDERIDWKHCQACGYEVHSYLNPKPGSIERRWYWRRPYKIKGRIGMVPSTKDFPTRQAAIRDAIKKNKEATP